MAHIGRASLLLAAFAGLGRAAKASGITPSVCRVTNPNFSFTYSSNTEILTLSLKEPQGTPEIVLDVDDSPRFRAPVALRATWVGDGYSGHTDAVAAALPIDQPLWVRVRRGGSLGCIRIQLDSTTWPVRPAAYALRSWNGVGRAWVSRYTGLKWNSRLSSWQLDPAWPYASGGVAQRAYYVEYAVRPALGLALRTGNVALLDELAGMYLSYLPRFTTLGALRSRKGPGFSTTLLDDQGADSSRTLGWAETDGTLVRIRECSLCTAQFFHPIAKLIRIVAQLPDTARTSNMRRFVAKYLPLVRDDHLIRLVFQAKWDYWGDKSLPPHLIDIWRTILATEIRRKPAYTHAMSDRDLWLVATAAELMTAHALDPKLVALGSDSASLDTIVHLGIALFQKETKAERVTNPLNKEEVTAGVYFDGDLDDHPDMQFAGDTGRATPAAQDSARITGSSWDISHAYRIPVFLRSLYDAKRAIGLEFPSKYDLGLAANAYVYAAAWRQSGYPLFHNYLDGRDGWFRVSGPPSKRQGFAPSKYCNTHDPTHGCLTPGGIQGWGLLGFASKGIRSVETELARLAADTSRQAVAFKDTKYWYGGVPFVWADSTRTAAESFLLFSLSGEFVGGAGH